MDIFEKCFLKSVFYRKRKIIHKNILLTSYFILVCLNDKTVYSLYYSSMFIPEVTQQYIDVVNRLLLNKQRLPISFKIQKLLHTSVGL